MKHTKHCVQTQEMRLREEKKKSGLDREILALGSKASKFAMRPLISANREKKKKRKIGGEREGEKRRWEGRGGEGR